MRLPSGLMCASLGLRQFQISSGVQDCAPALMPAASASRKRRTALLPAAPTTRRSRRGRSRSAARGAGSRSTAARRRRRMCQEVGDVLGSLGFLAGFAQEAEIAEPIDEAVLPGAVGREIAVGEAAGHAAAIGPRV